MKAKMKVMFSAINLLNAERLPFYGCRRLLLVRSFSKLGPTDLKGRKTAAQKWLKRQLTDPYVRRARQESYRCRSAFKLIEIDEKFDILRPGYVVLDCGSAPGSWSQVAVSRVNANGAVAEEPRGHVISVDLQHIWPLPGATVLDNCDIRSAETHERIKQVLNGRFVDVVLSDMAPAASGVRSLDHDCIVQLALSVLRLSLTIMTEKKAENDGQSGTLLVKLWQGNQTNSVMQSMRKCFANVQIVKPQSSRADSAEIFLLARQFSLSQSAV